MSSHVSLTLEDAVRYGIEKCVEKMISFTDQLRRLKVDQFEYVSMKLICLLTSGMTLLNPFSSWTMRNKQGLDFEMAKT